MSEETILIKIEVDQAEAIKNLQQSEKALMDLKAQQKSLNDSLKEGKITQDDYVESKVQLDSKIRQETDNRKTLIKTVETESNSLNAQRLKLAELIKERNNLDRSTESGAAAFNKINTQINGMSGAILKAESAGGSFQRNVGNYPELFNKMTGGIMTSAQGIGVMTKEALAFIATPLGAVLAALALGFGAMTTWLKHTGDGEDLLEKSTTQLGAVFDATVDYVSNFVGVIKDFVTADGPIQSTVKWFAAIVTAGFEMIAMATGAAAVWEGLKNAFGETIDEAGKLADKLDELGDRERIYNALTADRTNKIKELILQSKNHSLTEDERSAKLHQATELEIKDNEEITAIKREKLIATIQETEMANKRLGLQMKENETLNDFAVRLMNTNELADKYKDKISNAYKAIGEARTQSITILEKAQNADDALDQKKLLNVAKRQAAEEKAKNDRIKWLDDEVKKNQRAADEMLTVWINKINKESAAYKKGKDAELKADTFMNNASLSLTKTITAAETAEKKKGDDAQAESEKNLHDIVNSLEMEGLSVFKKNTIAYKLIASKRAIMSTAQGVSKALEQTPPLSYVLAVITAALGAVEIAKINNLQFARGGMVYGPSHAYGGSKFSVGGQVNELEGGEAVINKRSTSMFMPQLSAMNVAGGGVAFADGGLSTNSLSSPIDQSILGHSKQGATYVSWKEFNEFNSRMNNKISFVEA